VYQYIKGTADLKLTYSRMADTPAPLMYGYPEADWATTDIDERRTFFGYCLFLSGAVILWLTRFWKPCLSLMDGELGGVTEMAKNTIASRELMTSLPLSWYVLNKDIPTTDNPRHHSRAKHMDTFLAWVRHVILEGHIHQDPEHSFC
jgi:hypothetical protein